MRERVRAVRGIRLEKKRVKSECLRERGGGRKRTGQLEAR